MKQLIIFLALSCTMAHAQTPVNPANEVKPKQVCEESLTWTDTKPPLLPGAKVAVLEGNPKSEGHFTMRIILPPYYKVPPHIHPVDENTTVLRGQISIGFGDVLDTTQAVKLTAGCFYMNPKGVHHYFFTSAEETEIQISTNGPFGLELIGKKQ